MSSPVERVPYPEHPNRCAAVNSRGQCLNFGVQLPSGDYGANCLVHGGNKQVDSAKAASLRNYNLTRWRAQLQQKVDSDGIKSLRDEIGILRVVLEERLNRCKDAHDLILQSGPISDMVMKIERVVSSCHKLEGSMGQLMDKQAILQFASVVIDIISENISDELVLNTISEQLITAVGAM